VVPRTHWFEDADRALERAEDEELRGASLAPDTESELPLEAMDVCRGMSGPESAALATYLERVEVQAGRPLFREGDAGNRLYLLAKGEVTVCIRIAGKDGRTRRLVTYGPGVIIGEMAVLEGLPRSADAMALTDCVLYALDGAALARMQLEAAQLHSHFALNLARQLVVRLRALTSELRAAYS
jgi:CRP-like cAMP-binding protein